MLYTGVVRQLSVSSLFTKQQYMIILPLDHSWEIAVQSPLNQFSFNIFYNFFKCLVFLSTSVAL